MATSGYPFSRTIHSINAIRARHPEWFREDLERLFDMLASGVVRPRVAERIAFDGVAKAHHRIEMGGLDGKIVFCPDLPPGSERTEPIHGPVSV
jgi:NADPH:quinone reductase-like Zn-dependent oxidoreductase